MTIVTVTDSFDHPADKIWPAVSDFGGLHKFFRSMPEYRVEGTGLGQDRYIPMADGHVIERLTWLDEAALSFSYTIVEGPVPFQRYVSTVKLTPEGDRCAIVWQGTFEPDGVSEEEAVATATGIYTGVIKGIKRSLAG